MVIIGVEGWRTAEEATGQPSLRVKISPWGYTGASVAVGYWLLLYF
jgi:hypothetical protein